MDSKNIVCIIREFFLVKVHVKGVHNISIVGRACFSNLGMSS